MLVMMREKLKRRKDQRRRSVRVDNNSLLDDLLSNTAYRTMSSVKSYIDSEVLASESYYVIYIIVIAIRHETFYYIW
jgi:hypothetical protein